IGTTGASGQANKYLIDAQMIPGHTWAPGDTLAIEVRNVGGYYTNPTNFVTTAAGFDVAPTVTLLLAAGPSPSISLAPSTAYQGDLNRVITVTGTNTNFVGGTTNVTVSGAGVTVSNISVASATSLTFQVSIIAAAATGGRTVTVTTGGESPTATLTINSPSVAFVPSSANPGQTLSVSATGTGSHFAAGTTALGDASVVVNNINVTSATSATLNVTVPAGATLGAHNITFTTALGGGLGTETIIGSFSVVNPAVGSIVVNVNSGPSDLGYTNDNTPTFAGAAVSTQYPVAGIVYSLDGGAWTAIPASDGSYNSLNEAFSLNIGTPLIDGSHTIQFRATDTGGYTGTTSRTFVVDTVNPVISNVLFDSVSILDRDVISPTALVSATITDNLSGIDAATITVAFNNTTYNTTSTPDVNYDSVTGAMTLDFGSSTIPDGEYLVIINARDMAGNAATPYSINVVVRAGSAIVDGAAFNYPNPFNPNAEVTRIGYNLTNDANVAIYVYDITARLIWESHYSSGTVGGRLGYNEVQWDGRSLYREIMGSGVYLLRIVNEDNKSVIGKVKLVIALR
ncbi:MAG: Ig-like domain-containing protein, partial [bacterium]